MKHLHFFFACPSLFMITLVILSCDTTRNYYGGGQDGAALGRENGKCYAKCMIPPTYDTTFTSQIIYTGDEPERWGDQLEVETLIVEPARQSWVKKRVDRNCQSPNPEDCMVWCLVKKPEVTEEKHIVVDTIGMEDYERQIIIDLTEVDPGGYSDYREVICGGDISPDLIRRVNEALTVAGYDPGSGDEMDKTSRTALQKYQRDRGLPVGHLDMETLDRLGINF